MGDGGRDQIVAGRFDLVNCETGYGAGQSAGTLRSRTAQTDPAQSRACAACAGSWIRR